MHFMSSENFAINVVKYFFRSLINLCSSRGQHFLQCGAQCPMAAVPRVCLQLTPLLVREALSSWNVTPGQGNWCYHHHICPVQQTGCASCQQGSEQLEQHQPAGRCRAVRRAGLGVWHQPHLGKNSLTERAELYQFLGNYPRDDG